MSIPETVTHQDKLLTIDTNASKFLEGLLHPGVKVHPLFIDPYNGSMALRVKFVPGLTLPLHFHTGFVHAYTMSGCWYYTEYPDQKQTAGSYLYEPGGSVHQFNTPADNTEDTDAIFFVTGANINFASQADGGAYLGTMDAGWVKSWCDTAIKEQRAGKMNYIAASLPTYVR
jgi:quercetin dioxygenase-like cupin family protein